MTELKQDGWLKVAQGRTSIEEVLRVVVVTAGGAQVAAPGDR